MKVRTSFLTRCVAMVLALLMAISGVNLGAVIQAYAAENEITVGALMAKNYDLSEAEAALLASGYLAGSEKKAAEYNNLPKEGQVSVNQDEKIISADKWNGWVPVDGVITYNGKDIPFTLTDGKYSYANDGLGNAFSVKVNYKYETAVSVQEQFDILAIIPALKQGIANLEAVKAQSGNLVILETAMPELVKLANTGVETSFTTVKLNEVCKAAIYALNGQMTDNGGKLSLSAMVEAYETDSKTAYLRSKGATMQEEVVSVYEKTSEIALALDEIYKNIEWLIEGGFITQEVANNIKTLAGVCRNLVNGLAAVAEDPWTVATTPALLNNSGEALDALVAALGELKTIDPVATLLVAEASQSFNMSMFNVTVEVILETTQDNEVKEYGKKEATITLKDGAKQSEIVDAINENGIENASIAAWGDIYVADKFVREADSLPETLNKDITYTITYSPKIYTVTLADEGDKEYPYGYKLILPLHEDPAKAYDYKADGVYYAQGDEVIIEDDMTFTREEGKAYIPSSLYKIISDNYGTEKITAILTSGAVLGNEEVSYREPSKGELEELVKLDGSTLTVQSYPSSYAGLNWEPYSYVVDNTEHLFKGKTEVIIDGDFETVNVYYRLTLTNYAEAVEEILMLVEILDAEAKDQKSVMDRLIGYEDQMAQLNRNMLNGLNGVIGGYSTENGGGLHPDPAMNDELVAYFQETIAAIVKSCTEGNDLRLNNIIKAYKDPNNGGLIYYYQNDVIVRNEIGILSAYLNDMLDGGDRQAALEKLMAENGYSDKVDVLETLGSKLAEINAELMPVNAAIDTSDAAKLGALAKALTMDGSIAYQEFITPYVEMGPVIRTAEKYVTIEVKVNADGKTNTDPIAVTIEKGAALTQAQVNGLKDAVASFVTDEAKIETAYYNNTYNNGAQLDALVGVALTEGASYTYEWTPKTYTVKIAGEADQTVDVKNLTVTLPAHTVSGKSYEYTIGSKTATSGIFTFDKEDLLNLFVNGEFTITRTEKDLSAEALVTMVNTINAEMGFEALSLVETNGAYTGINANIALSDMMDLMMNLVLKSGYGYIGLNNEGFIYSNDKAELELSIQTLINAILNDKEFNNAAVIALGEKGKGKIMTTSMQLGGSAAELQYSDLTFTMNLNSVPEQLTNNVDTLKTVSNYLKFQSNGGVLDVDVNLPDQVYAAYAAALYATGNVDKADAGAIDQAVAMQFLYDYLEAITGSEMDMITFTNTLKKLGVDKDLTGYNNYYTAGVKAYTEWVEVAISSDGAEIKATIPGQTAIDGLLKVAGIDKASLSTYLGMIKEYKANGEIVASMKGELANAGKTYYALIGDIQADGVSNKIAAPTTPEALAAKTQKLSGYSAMILLNDVTGSLTISGTTILDLNGKDINGAINATGTLIIIDSSMDTYNAGTVTGSVSGNVTILGGNYTENVDACLMDGYYKDGTAVRNALYYITDKDGTVTFVINGDVFEDENVDGIIPDVKALAIDIAADLLLNYAMSGKLSVGGYELVGINIEDLVGLYAGKDRVNTLANKLLDCVFIGEEDYDKEIGFEAVVNMILEDLLNFANISDALNPETENNALATYAVTTEPWYIEIEHITDGNYATVDFTTNSEKAKSFNVALAIESKYNEQLSALAGELANIVVADETFAEVDIPKPTYSGKTLTVVGKGQANAVVDMFKNEEYREAYPVMIAVILANGNSAKRADVAAAINAEGGVNMAALKKVIDNTTVAEIFTALKAMNRGENFAAMASKVKINVDVDIAAAAELEAIYHTVLCGMGKALEKLEITGMSSKLGNLYNKDTGYYELQRADILRDKEFSARGYTARVELEADELLLKVKLFGEVEEEPDCLWGDANHDNEVNELDASLILQYCVGEAPDIFCTLRTDVNGDGEITELDASLVLQFAAKDIDKFPVEN